MQIASVMQKVIDAQHGRLMVVCEDMVAGALNTFITNCVKPDIPFLGVVVRVPEFGERKKDFLEDLAVFTGGTLVSQQSGMKLEEISIEQLGRAKKMTVDREKTILLSGGGSEDSVQGHVKELQALSEKGLESFESSKVKERISRLTSKAAVVKVCASTDVERKELRLRVEDALSAVKSAMDEGIVPGGGTAFIRIRSLWEKDEKTQILNDFINFLSK